MAWPTPVTLTGTFASLAPLSHTHAADLSEAAAENDLWKLWYTSVPHPDKVAAEIERRLSLQNDGSMLPFAVLDPTGKAVGMTTFMNIDATHKRVEIGSTWYRTSVQRTPLNTQCKRLLLTHAFEDLDCIAVEFRTHFMNRQSRTAIERLGAKLDGVLRSHQRTPDGALRDTAVYSILPHEWPAVRTSLDFKLNSVA
ncbi:N-acetyltransferase [Roseibium denhamense]|uniref:Protein N-acetyltransferase, RimJ/RimL family n=1 Tax=Roseibium denhamense TaxID=76305 RepID=A0ABY1NUZ6_9HYPH|nr:GNAT family protein [Roseibium denhamense]MTI08128.1 N-acetyltransferase [Roseibium denhamense]SMP16616.1 Protein N-acetyltransferase, RimJ/RimL family [Roseibium denhamense]